MMPMAEARSAVSRARAHVRPVILAELYEQLAPHLWLRLAGEFWTRCEGDRTALSALMQTFEDWSGLMTSPREAVVHARFPSELVVWRGCYRGLNEDGLSYSVDADGARQYPLRGVYRVDGGEAVMVRALVLKAQCAVKMDCGRMEVLVRQAVSRRTYPHHASLPHDQYDVLTPERPLRCRAEMCLHQPS